MTEHLRIERRDHVCVAHLTGDIDLANAGSLEQEILAAFEEGWMLGVVLDLSQVTFLDSAAIRLLFSLHTTLSGQGRSVAVVIPPDAPFRRVLEITAVPTMLATAPSVDEAVAMLQRRT